MQALLRALSARRKVIVMGSVKSSVSGRKAAAARLAVLIIIVQALGLRVGWSQETVQPQLEDEFAKQEQIYSSRGADVPEGYVTTRGLSDYAKLLPTGFCEALGKLGSSDRWLDIGAGEGQAMLDYYAPDNAAAPAQKCGGSGAKARSVAMSIEDRQTDKWREQTASLGYDRLRYLSGKRLRQFSIEDLGRYRIITDVYGGFSYTEDLSKFVETVLSLLEVDGGFYTLLQSVRLENIKDDPNVVYLTELLDPSGSDVKVCSWLKKISCASVNCESKTDWSPSALIHLRKVCSDISVPRTKLLKFEAGSPPGRKFQLEP